jgi:hypothetical protein
VKISVFPRLKKPGNLCGSLGLFLEKENCAVGVNCPPGVVALLRNSLEKENCFRHLILPGANPVNLGGIERFARLEKATEGQGVQLYAPELVSGWIKALLMETDYSSKALKELAFETYKFDAQSCIIGSAPVSVEYLPDNNGFFDSLLRFSFYDMPVKIHFGDAVDLTKEFPACLVGAETLIINLSRHPAIPCAEDSKGMLDDLLEILSVNKVKTAVIPTSEGILLALPADKPEYREYVDENIYELKIASAKLKIIHERDFAHYREAIFPVLVQDEDEKDSILLGMGLGTALHRRMDDSGKFDFKTMLITDSGYKKVFSCIDLLEQSGGKPMEIICGKSMCDAINYFKLVLKKTCNRSIPDIAVSPSEEKKTTQHIMFNNMEVLMVPFPKNSDAYIARVKELNTGDYLIFTESMDNPYFLERNLKGIDTLVAALDTNDDLTRSRHRDRLKAMQEKYKVQRLVIMFPGETAMFSLDI